MPFTSLSSEPRGSQTHRCHGWAHALSLAKLLCSPRTTCPPECEPPRKKALSTTQHAYPSVTIPTATTPPSMTHELRTLTKLPCPTVEKLWLPECHQKGPPIPDRHTPLTLVPIPKAQLRKSRYLPRKNSTNCLIWQIRAEIDTPPKAHPSSLGIDT